MLIGRLLPTGIQLWRFSSEAVGADRQAELVATLHLPELKSHAHFMVVTSHMSPFTANIPRDQPFATSEEARVHILYIRITTMEQIDNPRPK